MPAAACLLCLAVLLSTTAPTIYNFDSVEFAIGARTLGLVHAPGYPLYLLVGHVFSYLPVGDVGYRFNLFSALCLAFVVPFLYGLLRKLDLNRLYALTASLMFVWSYYVWGTGVVAEIYAPQMLTLAICGLALVTLYHRPQNNSRAVLVGILYGVAVATCPSSILFAPGLVAAFRLMRIPWRASMAAALAGAALFFASLLYFPFRYAANPAFNMLGKYGADGSFHPVNLRTLSGIWWTLRGQQFSNLFFADGVLPTGKQAGEFAAWLWGNYFGVGVVAGGAGLYHMARSRQRLFLVWAALFLPYTTFFVTYGAPDRDTMFGPTYLLWAVAVAFGLQWFGRYVALPERMQPVFLAMPLVMLVVNFPLVNLREDTSVYDRSALMLDAIPQGASVFGLWWDVVPLQYLQIIEDRRPDLKTYNLFLYKHKDAEKFIDSQVADSGHAVIFLGSYGKDYIDVTRHKVTTLWRGPDDSEDEDAESQMGVFLVESLSKD